MYNKRAFCKGLLCRKSDRKFKSIISGKRICNLCSMDTPKGKVTIDEYFTTAIDWEKLNKEFEEMLIKKDEKTNDIVITNKHIKF